LGRSLSANLPVILTPREELAVLIDSFFYEIVKRLPCHLAWRDILAILAATGSLDTIRVARLGRFSHLVEALSDVLNANFVVWTALTQFEHKRTRWKCIVRRKADPSPAKECRLRLKQAATVQ
jgi:hypothetical protein